MLLETRKLSVFYGEKKAVDNVSLSFSTGEVTALIGPSGCGKSSFLRCLNRMNDFIDDARIEGEVILDGEYIYSPEIDPVLVRRKVGMVFQKANPFPKSIFENIAWAPKMAGVPKREIPNLVERSLKQAALWDEVKDRIHGLAFNLSGGQQQRLCIARALATDPEIVLFDEPTSALDPVATARIEELVGELKQRVTILIVTHNMQQAARISDFTGFMYLGELAEFDKTDKIFTNPANKVTEDYVTGRFG
jgi:phosphate transport system ATP-binding protein